MTTASPLSPVRDQDSSRLIRGIMVLLACAVAVVAQLGWLAYLLPVRSYHNAAQAGASFQLSDVANSALFLLITSFGALIVMRSTNRRIGWLMLAIGFTLAVINFTAEYSQYALLVAPQAGLPLGLFAAWVQDLWPILFLLLFSLPFLFPDGRLPSRRWSLVFWSTITAWILFTFLLAFTRRPLANAFLELETRPLNPVGFLPAGELLLNTLFAALLGVSIVTGIASVVTRWRRSRGAVRQQIKWVLYAFLVLLLTLAASWANTLLVEGAGIDLGLEKAIDVATNLSLLGMIAALGMAVLRYRLYDIDLVMNRTLVYGALTAVIILTYVFFVAGVGALMPLEENLFLSLLATGVVAVLFNPLRVRLQRAANRLMFGRRDDPYAVLSALGRHLSNSAAPDATLQAVVEAVAGALRVPYATIQLEQDGGYENRAEYGSVDDTAAAGNVALPLLHQNEIVGRLVVAPRAPGESLTAKDRQLLEDIAHQAGAVAHAVRLTAALQRSRERLVLAREEERRRIRRDLHDGLGPSLASQTFKLDAALDLLPDDPQKVVGHLESLKQQNQRLVADIRRLVYELRPPALDELGLAGALKAHAGQVNSANALKITVVTRPDPLPVLPAAVEVAAYRIALEGITNVVRHAGAGTCTVALQAEGARLLLTVGDDGVGLPPDMGAGVGLASMRERAEELGGFLEIEARRPRGTRVTAMLPISGSIETDASPASDDGPVSAGVKRSRSHD